MSTVIEYLDLGNRTIVMALRPFPKELHGCSVGPHSPIGGLQRRVPTAESTPLCIRTHHEVDCEFDGDYVNCQFEAHPCLVGAEAFRRAYHSRSLHLQHGVWFVKDACEVGCTPPCSWFVSFIEFGNLHNDLGRILYSVRQVPRRYLKREDSVSKELEKTKQVESQGQE